MKTKVISISLALLAIYIVFAFLIPRMMKEPKLTPWPKTVNLICCILDDYTALNDSEQQQFISNVTTKSDSLSVNTELAAILQSTTNKFRSLEEFNLSNGVLHDAWGTPLLFSLTNNATNGGLAPLLTGIPRPFVVWSAGPNRTNEFGLGDDVIVTGR